MRECMQTNDNKSKLKSPLKMLQRHFAIGEPRQVSHVSSIPPEPDWQSFEPEPHTVAAVVASSESLTIKRNLYIRRISHTAVDRTFPHQHQ